MKTLMRKYFYSQLIALIGLSYTSLHAQSALQPRCLHLGIDIGRIAYYGLLRESSNDILSYKYTAASRDITKPKNPKYNGLQYEFNLAIQYKLLIIDVDFGFGSAEWKGKYTKMRSEQLGKDKAVAEDIESIYKSTGYYTKFGFDINFLTNTPENNAAFLGLRYCLSFFRDKLKTKHVYASERIENPKNQVDSKTIILQDLPSYNNVDNSQSNVRATWLEAIAGARVKIIGPVFVGCNIRYKFWLSLYNAYKHEPYEVLGWGLTSDPVDKTVFGYNFYISFGLPIATDDVYDRTAGRKEKPIAPLL